MFECLPDEVIVIIGLYLPIGSVSSFSRVDKRVNALLTSESFWKRLTTCTFKKRHASRKSHQQRFKSMWSSIDWWEENTVLRFQLENIVERFTRFECNEPTSEEDVFNLVTSDLWEEEPDELEEDEPIQALESLDETHRTHLHPQSLIFFVNNFPGFVKPFLFKRFSILGMSLFDALLTCHWRYSSDEKDDFKPFCEALRSVLIAFPDQCIEGLSCESFNGQCRFRELISMNAIRTVSTIVEVCGVEAFSPCVTQTVGTNTIFRDLYGSEKKVAKMFCWLHSNYRKELKSVFRKHVLSISGINPLVFITNEVKHIGYMKMLFKAFKQEIALFVDFADKSGIMDTDSWNMKLQTAYCFAKTIN